MLVTGHAHVIRNTWPACWSTSLCGAVSARACPWRLPIGGVPYSDWGPWRASERAAPAPSKTMFCCGFHVLCMNLDAESTDYFKASLLFRELRVLRSRLQPRVDEVLNTWTFRCDWAPGRSVDQANACYLPNVYRYYPQDRVGTDVQTH